MQEKLMTVFSVAIEVGHPVGGDLTQVSALVDTGAHHSMMPESLLEQLHIQPIAKRNFSFADGGAEILGIGQARIAILGEEWVCPVIFGPEGKYLLGATTLEAFDLAVDPSRRELVQLIHPERPYLSK